MHILVSGASGMLGNKLARRLMREGKLGARPITRLTLTDIVPPKEPAADGSSEFVRADFAKGEEVRDLVKEGPDVIFHLGAIVSGEAEREFEKGLHVNLMGGLNLFEAIRTVGQTRRYTPKVIFSSSIAVFGPPFPDTIDQDTALTPRTSYGTQKAALELLLSDYSRRGFLDGIGLRLPTICIRPGAPNAALSGFFSSILREPLIGEEAVLPVPDTTRHWMTGPRSAIEFFLHAATLDTAALGAARNLNMPGLSVSVAEQIEALRDIAGDAAVRRIKYEPDPEVARVVETWPWEFDDRFALSLGFRKQESVREIIRAHIEDELGGGL